jgi:hypothetical protein
LIGPGDRKAGAAAWPFTARVQQGERMGRIGVLSLTDADKHVSLLSGAVRTHALTHTCVFEHRLRRVAGNVTWITNPGVLAAGNKRLSASTIPSACKSTVKKVNAGDFRPARSPM